jgi:translation initiation factor 2B subunit (eIF-2B alpha/beta/delta family)
MAEHRNPALPANISRAVGEVERDREHGASWLARRAAEILASAAQPSQSAGGRSALERLQAIQIAARTLARIRPSMAAIANTAAMVTAAAFTLPQDADETECEARLAEIHRQAVAVAASWSSAAKAILEHARPLLGSTLYTHSRSGTVEYAIMKLAEERGPNTVTVIASQSHPGDEGIGLATTLAQAGIHVLLVADGACGLFVGNADAVIIGADSVTASADVVNKVGTYPLALAARESQVPVYVCCEALKIAAGDTRPTFEEMDARELMPEPTPGVTVRNVYFDLTPHELITRIITEQGVLMPQDVRSLAQQARRSLARLGP